MKKSFRIKTMLTLLPLLIASHSLAATITATPTDNLQAKLDAAANGTLLLGAGTFNVSTPLNVHTRTTIQGAPDLASHVVFNLKTTDITLYGLAYDPNASNVTIQGIDFVSNHGLVAMGNGVYSGDTITGCNIQTNGGQSSAGILVMGISCTTSCPGLSITHNYFHDDTSARIWTLWSTSNAHLDNNLFFNINDGGQLCNTGANVSFSFNYGTHIHRMGQEISMTNTGGLVVKGNVFYDWLTPYFDSEGVSVVMNAIAPAPLIDSNYFRINIAPGSTWGQKDPNMNRSGYAIESGGNGCIVSNNTLGIQNGAEFVTYMGQGESITNNKCFGASAWNINFGTDPGPQGNGTATLTNNPVDANLADMPAPPANTFAGPQNNSKAAAPAGISPVASASALAGLTATPSTNGVTLAWTSPITNLSIHTSTPTDDCGTLTLAGPTTSATLANLNPGWRYSTAISGTLNGATVSGAVTFQTTGTSPPGTSATIAQLPQPATPVHTIQTFSDGSIVVDGGK